MLKTELLAAFIRQRKQLGQPDLILNPDAYSSLLLMRVSQGEMDASSQRNAAAVSTNTHTNNSQQLKAPSTPPKKAAPSIKSKLASLRPVESLVPPSIRKNEPSATNISVPGAPPVSKRDGLKKLFLAGCTACHLSSSRTKWVFGAGNADAPVMVIGEAPGAEEDAQGLPFVGAAGQLLTSMLSAIKLDRSKNVFITNVLKCRPPQNRSPESAEIQVCLPILKKQIDIIQPRAILLLGRIAAHALMGTTESISSLRSKIHDYQGIPVMVIYHPAALLRNAQYKRPAWEDLQKFQALLEKLRVYEVLQ